MHMRYPKFLKENGTIGFVAPSFGCNIEPYRSAFENAQKKFKNLGYQVCLGPNCYAGEGIGISNTPEKCGGELTEGYVGRESDCLISCGGGELMCETLEYVDFEAIKQAEPKWYMGYSDNTNMTFLLATLCDTASVYGPCAAAFGMEPWHPALQDAFDTFTGKSTGISSYEKWEKEGLKDEEHPLLPYNCTEESKAKIFVPEGKEIFALADVQNMGRDSSQKQKAVYGYVQTEGAVIKGRLLGGCMDCLVNLTGTKFDKVKVFNEKYKEDGIIWFLEACDLNVFGIRRAMWQMEQAGWFEHVKGFLIGRPLCHGQEMMGLDQYGAVLYTAAKHGVPVIMDADLGHLPPMMPMVTGAVAEITVEDGKVYVQTQYK